MTFCAGSLRKAAKVESMTLELAKEILKIDTSYEDERITAIINILPHYIFERTGYPINKQATEPLCELLEQFLLRDFYEPEYSDAPRGNAIKSLLTTLKLKVDAQNLGQVNL